MNKVRLLAAYKKDGEVEASSKRRNERGSRGSIGLVRPRLFPSPDVSRRLETCVQPEDAGGEGGRSRYRHFRPGPFVWLGGLFGARAG